MELHYDNNDLLDRKRCELLDENGCLSYWGIYDFAFKYRTRIFDANDDEVAYVQKNIALTEDVVEFFDPGDQKIGSLLKSENGYHNYPEDLLYEGDVQKGMIKDFMKVTDHKLYIENKDEALKAAMILFALVEVER